MNSSVINQQPPYKQANKNKSKNKQERKQLSTDLIDYNAYLYSIYSINPYSPPLPSPPLSPTSNRKSQVTRTMMEKLSQYIFRFWILDVMIGMIISIE